MEREMFGVTAFVFPRHCCTGWSPMFLGMAEHPPAHGKHGMNSLWLLLYLSTCLYINPCVFFPFTLLIVSPIPAGARAVSEWRCWGYTSSRNISKCLYSKGAVAQG